VAPPGFIGIAPGLAPEITIPLSTETASASSGLPTGLHLMGRLRDGVTMSAANTRFFAASGRLVALKDE
jgi:hypothetical protein